MGKREVKKAQLKNREVTSIALRMMDGVSLYINLGLKG